MVRFEPYIRAVARWLIVNSDTLSLVTTPQDKAELTRNFIKIAREYCPDKETAKECFTYLFLTEEGARSLVEAMGEEREKLNAY